MSAVRKAGWGLMTVLACLVAAYALAGIVGARTPFVEALFTEKALRVVAHLGAGSVAIVAGALQFSTKIRFETPHRHRLLGQLYLAAALVSGGAGAALAPTSSGGVSAHWGFGALAVLWVLSTVVAVRCAMAGAYDDHRRWMIRSYALCLAAVTLRLYLPAFAVSGVAFDFAYPAIAWLCWVPNLVVAEWLVIPSSLAPLEPADASGSRQP